MHQCFFSTCNLQPETLFFRINVSTAFLNL
jgi:hypothetical protein